VFQGLRELLEISQRHASLPKIKRTVTHAEQSVQTDPATNTTSSCNNNNNNALFDNDTTNGDGLTVEITLPMPPVAPPRTPKAAKVGGRMGGTALTGSSLSITRVESSPEPGGYFTCFFVYQNVIVFALSQYFSFNRSCLVQCFGSRFTASGSKYRVPGFFKSGSKTTVFYDKNFGLNSVGNIFYKKAIYSF
jgi:hypothetical protein